MLQNGFHMHIQSILLESSTSDGSVQQKVKGGEANYDSLGGEPREGRWVRKRERRACHHGMRNVHIDMFQSVLPFLPLKNPSQHIQPPPQIQAMVSSITRGHAFISIKCKIKHDQ